MSVILRAWSMLSLLYQYYFYRKPTKFGISEIHRLTYPMSFAHHSQLYQNNLFKSVTLSPVSPVSPISPNEFCFPIPPEQLAANALNPPNSLLPSILTCYLQIPAFKQPNDWPPLLRINSITPANKLWHCPTINYFTNPFLQSAFNLDGQFLERNLQTHATCATST
jgi:hypothetical protein